MRKEYKFAATWDVIIYRDYIKDFIQMDQLIKKILNSGKQELGNMKDLPPISCHISIKQTKMLDEAIQQNMGRVVEVNIFRLLLAQVHNRNGDPRGLNCAIDINFPQISMAGIGNEARLIICETIIVNDHVIRAHTVQQHLQALQAFCDKNDKQFGRCNEFRARMQVIKAGLFLLNSNFHQAAIFYLNAFKNNYFLDNERERMQLMQMAIAMAFICDKNAETHKIVCSLYINETAKRTKLYPLLIKLYSESMIEQKDLESVKQFLTPRMETKDSDNVSILQKAIFSHNMLAIMKSFSKISLTTLSQMMEIGQEQMLIMVEKIYRAGEIKVDQVEGFIQVVEEENSGEVMTKKWFNKVDELLGDD